MTGARDGGSPTADAAARAHTEMMMTRTTAVRWILSGVALLLAAASCSDPEVITEADPSTTVAPSDTADERDDEGADATSTTTTAPAGPAAVGAAITVEGSDIEVAVTLRRVIDPATPPEFLNPELGHHLVAVELGLHNMGPSVYRDSPGNGATLLGADNTGLNETLGGATECRSFTGSVILPPGDVRVGCLVFEVPDGFVPAGFQFTADSGFGQQTAQWDLSAPGTDPGAPPASTAAGAAVGEAITVEGSDVTLQVTVSDATDPAPAGQFGGPAAGHRYVAVTVEIANTGDTAYADSPGNGATLIGSDAAQYSETLSDGGGCTTFGGSVTVAPGEIRAGCMVFELPEGVVAAAFQFTPDSGFADDTARWNLA